MIGSLRGVLQARLSATDVLVDVGGVGYRVTMTAPAAVAVGPTGADVFLHVHTHVREDAIVLFGFAHADERRCFEALLGAHGVGPSLALAILAVLSPAALATAVAEQDVETLSLVPGVGRKTAARLALELASRLDVPVFDAVEALHAAAGGEGGGGATGAPALPGIRADVRAALTGLGYSPEETAYALSRLGEAASVEDALRTALRELSGRRGPTSGSGGVSSGGSVAPAGGGADEAPGAPGTAEVPAGVVEPASPGSARGAGGFDVTVDPDGARRGADDGLAAPGRRPGPRRTKARR